MTKTGRWALGMVVLLGCGGGSEETTHDMEETSGDEMHEVEEQATDEMDEAAAAADIVDTAVAAGSFQTLVAAVQAAELVETLKGDGPFTVFAPTDDAFAALPEGTVENLLLPENRDQLVRILTYHVVSGDIRAAQVVTTPSVTTLQGGEIAIDASGEGVRVGEANVVQADIVTSNGVIHVIDAVLMPQ